MKNDELREHVRKHWGIIKAKILENKYKSSPVRRVKIDKPDGGVRLLGIPTVQDRLIQHAIAQVLSRIYEQLFSENSFGFRPRRGAGICQDSCRISLIFLFSGDYFYLITFYQ